MTRRASGRCSSSQCACAGGAIRSSSPYHSSTGCPNGRDVDVPGPDPGDVVPPGTLGTVAEPLAHGGDEGRRPPTGRRTAPGRAHSERASNPARTASSPCRAATRSGLEVGGEDHGRLGGVVREQCQPPWCRSPRASRAPRGPPGTGRRRRRSRCASPGCRRSLRWRGRTGHHPRGRAWRSCSTPSWSTSPSASVRHARESERSGRSTRRNRAGRTRSAGRPPRQRGRPRRPGRAASRGCRGNTRTGNPPGSPAMRTCTVPSSDRECALGRRHETNPTGGPRFWDPAAWTSFEEFPPQVLRDYALLADGERGALIGPQGDLAWLCVPALGLRRRLLDLDRRGRLLRPDAARAATPGAATTPPAR